MDTDDPPCKRDGCGHPISAHTMKRAEKRAHRTGTMMSYFPSGREEPLTSIAARASTTLATRRIAVAKCLSRALPNGAIAASRAGTGKCESHHPLCNTGFHFAEKRANHRNAGSHFLRSGISSPSRGAFPPRRRMILSKAAKSARALRSAKYRAVRSADTFSATAVTTN